MDTSTDRAALADAIDVANRADYGSFVRGTNAWRLAVADALIARGWSRSPRPTNPHPRVQGRCPACGSESLFLGAGGYVTCGLIECREPDAATTALEPAARPATVSEVLEAWDLGSDALESLQGAALDVIAWQLHELTMDTADRSPSAEDHRVATEHAARLLPHLTTQPADVDLPDWCRCPDDHVDRMVREAEERAAQAESDADTLMDAIDGARHALWSSGPKIEPARERLASVPREVRERYDGRKWDRHCLAGGNIPTRSRAVNPARSVRDEGGDDYPLICDGCGRHLPCRHCDEGTSGGGR